MSMNKGKMLKKDSICETRCFLGLDLGVDLIKGLIADACL